MKSPSVGQEQPGRAGMPILCGSESATVVKEVKPAAQIVAEMVEEARAILAGRR